MSRTIETVECECGWAREKWRRRCANLDCPCSEGLRPWAPEEPRGACSTCLADWAGAKEAKAMVAECRTLALTAPGSAWRRLQFMLGVSKHEAKALLEHP